MLDPLEILMVLWIKQKLRKFCLPVHSLFICSVVTFAARQVMRRYHPAQAIRPGHLPCISTCSSHSSWRQPSQTYAQVSVAKWKSRKVCFICCVTAVNSGRWLQLPSKWLTVEFQIQHSKPYKVATFNKLSLSLTLYTHSGQAVSLFG